MNALDHICVMAVGVTSARGKVSGNRETGRRR
jgi:hypothetical protein